MDADIIDFYNGGAQVQSTSGGTDMTTTFTADGDGETVDHGYVPRANSKLADGPAYDTVTIGGVEHLLLKKGYTYDVELLTGEGKDDINEVIAAPEAHASIPLPKGVEVGNVVEHEEPEVEEPALGTGETVETTESTTPEAPTEEQLAADAEATGKLGDEEGADAPENTEE